MQFFTRMGTVTSKITCPIIAVAMSVQFYFQFLFYRKMCQWPLKIHTNTDRAVLFTLSHWYPSKCTQQKETNISKGKKLPTSQVTLNQKKVGLFFSHCSNCQHCVKFRHIILGIKQLDQRLDLSDIAMVLYQNLIGPYTPKIWNILYLNTQSCSY